MFTNQTIDELLEQMEHPELVFSYYRPAVSVGEALQHPAVDFQFWTNYAGQ